MRIAMRWLLAVVLGLVLVPVLSTTGADADTNCTTIHPNPYTNTRYCQIDTNVSGAYFSGVASWNYADSRQAPAQGYIEGKIVDPNHDSYCATAKVSWQETSTTQRYYYQVGQACGYNDHDGVLVTLEQGGQSWENARTGIYKLWACSPYSDCVQLWSQNIEATTP